MSWWGMYTFHWSTEASRFACKNSNSSVPSNISIPSYSAKSSAESLPTPRSEAEILSSPHVKAFSFNELKNATRNFRPDSLLGEGGFGYVFKGWIDEHTLTAARPGSGLVIAVKKLKPEGFQGHKEWLVSVFYHTTIHGLVKLSLRVSERLAMVFRQKLIIWVNFAIQTLLNSLATARMVTIGYWSTSSCQKEA